LGTNTVTEFHLYTHTNHYYVVKHEQLQQAMQHIIVFTASIKAVH